MKGNNKSVEFSICEILIRIDILKNFFNLTEIDSVAKEVLFSSKELLYNFLLEFKRLSKELKFKIKLKFIFMIFFFYIMFKVKDYTLPDSFFLFLYSSYRFFLKMFMI